MDQVPPSPVFLVCGLKDGLVDGGKTKEQSMFSLPMELKVCVCLLDPGVEGAGLRHHGRGGEADVGVGSEPAAGAETP